MQISGTTPRDTKIDPIAVITAISVDDYTSIRDIARKIGVYPSAENLKGILAVCREREQTHTQAGVLSSIRSSDDIATFPRFKWA